VACAGFASRESRIGTHAKKAVRTAIKPVKCRIFGLAGSLCEVNAETFFPILHLGIPHLNENVVNDNNIKTIYHFDKFVICHENSIKKWALS
jgi:hypothetical protein